MSTHPVACLVNALPLETAPLGASMAALQMNVASDTRIPALPTAFQICLPTSRHSRIPRFPPLTLPTPPFSSTVRPSTRAGGAACRPHHRSRPRATRLALPPPASRGGRRVRGERPNRAPSLPIINDTHLRIINDTLVMRHRSSVPVSIMGTQRAPFLVGRHPLSPVRFPPCGLAAVSMHLDGQLAAGRVRPPFALRTHRRRRCPS